MNLDCLIAGVRHPVVVGAVFMDYGMPYDVSGAIKLFRRLNRYKNYCMR